ncbi:tyrosine--tRNA ligase, chloroplastic/mitochondrial isoform X1 [Ricinus communis]|uniref:tyrosine--tRNA ligase, chloroplastic/mitochondrial isoform X1 n=1 Tax=Ricinus communis TaxID=3988 RepID=UPI00201ACFF6|nr:tyrosine--tRNA ligase, chloroplastic/mitochondrial isoform X1 [Ricinus communis]
MVVVGHLWATSAAQKTISVTQNNSFNRLSNNPTTMAATAAARTLLFSTQSHLKHLSFPFSNPLSTKLPTLKKNHIFIRSLQSATHQVTTTQTQESIRRQNVVDILEERGLLESVTSDNLRSACSISTLKVYCGFDPTAESLHLGNLIGIIVLSWFQRCGHKAFALIGGATGRIGDPSGKSSERPELDLDSLEKNILGISNTLTRIFNADVNLSNPIVVLNNYDWWKDVKLLDFLKQVGRYARVGTMIGKESVKKRLESEQGMSYTEFSYQLLQGFDFLHLFKNKGVNVEIGGSDQWGNITAGTELIRKILQPEDGAEAYGLTFPLLLKSDGTKFGKSEDGAIWLSPSFLSPYKFYQYFFSIADDDVIRFLKILTFLELDEIAELEREMKRPGYVPNTAQRRLAEEVTRFVHGQDGLLEAIKATEALRPGAETKLDWKTIEGIAEDVPSCSLAYDQVLNLSLVDLSVTAGLIDSKSAARRLLKQGGLYLNNSRVDSESKRVESQDIVEGKVLLLSAGKKNKVIVRIS